MFERPPSSGVILALAIGSVIATLLILGRIGWQLYEAIRLGWE